MSRDPESRAEEWLAEFVAAEDIEVLPDVHASFAGLAHAGADWIAQLDEVGLLRTVVACETAIARTQAVQLRALARLGRLQGDARSTAAEVALAVSTTENRAQGQLDLAETLTTRLPHTLAAMESGNIDSYKASKVADATALLDDVTAGEADTILADRLAGKNPSGLRQATARVAARLDPAGADSRAAERRHTRMVTLRPGGEGMATLAAELPAEQATAIYTRLDRAARKMRGSGEERNLDQLRADLFAELCLGTGGAAVKPPVTDVSLAEPPADGAAHNSTTGEPGTVGHPVATGPVRTEVFVYISAATLVGVSDERDLDHNEAWSSQSGATSAVNLLGFCRKHHRLKDHPGWAHQHDHDTGTLTVSTPAGQNHTSVPDEPPF